MLLSSCRIEQYRKEKNSINNNNNAVAVLAAALTFPTIDERGLFTD
jgi:hypothetical protein